MIAARVMLFAFLAGFIDAAVGQDATGLGGLPQGKAATGVTRAKTMSLPSAYAFGARSVQAPLLIAAETNPEAPHRPEAASAGPRGGCERSSADLCYDSFENHIVYRPARQFMPEFHGLTAENISLRRHGIRFRYSFP
jgi:hypothetical protein